VRDSLAIASERPEEQMATMTGNGGGTGVVASETVRLTIPASLEFVRIVRLVASGVGTRVGFDVGEIEDLRVAVDELTSLLVDASGGHELQLDFNPRVDSLEIEGRAQAGGSSPLLVEDLSRQILAAVVDEYSVDATDGEVRFRCLKRLSV
jgi:serine/threonine-protein kinase RsbW